METTSKKLTPFRFELFSQCPKAMWKNAYQPEDAIEPVTLKAAFAAMPEIRDYAKTLFSNVIDVLKRKDNFYDYDAMIGSTKDILEYGKGETIFGAAFEWNGNIANVGVLEHSNTGFVIYDIKESAISQSEPDAKKLAKYVNKMAYTKFILEKCGLKINDVKVISLNSDYVRGDELSIPDLFTITSIGDMVGEVTGMEEMITEANNALMSETCPACRLGRHCKDPYECLFLKHCMKSVPENSVFNLYRVQFAKAADEFYAGNTTFKVLNESKELRERSADKKAKGFKLNELHRTQIESVLNDKTIINVDGLHSFVGKITYPLYFLDFETIMPVIPAYKDSKAYQQIPFQYSLDYIEKEGDDFKHKEFLAKDDSTDPRYEVARHIVNDIPMDVCVIAYNKMFECGRLKEMAAMFPEFSEHLLNISEHIVDLLEPFSKGYYYKPEMNGSFSIKSVLPAVFPDDPSLNYKNLEGTVHNGMEAMEIFPQIKNSPEDIAEGIRRSLLLYCGLDTYAMVRLFQDILEKIG